MIYNITTKTMDSTLTSDKRYLFAHCFTDGALDEIDMCEEQRTAMIIGITKIKDAMLKNTPQKYQNNVGGQNKAKVSK